MSTLLCTDGQWCPNTRYLTNATVSYNGCLWISLQDGMDGIRPVRDDPVGKWGLVVCEGEPPTRSQPHNIWIVYGANDVNWLLVSPLITLYDVSTFLKTIHLPRSADTFLSVLRRASAAKRWLVIDRVEKTIWTIGEPSWSVPATTHQDTRLVHAEPCCICLTKNGENASKCTLCRLSVCRTCAHRDCVSCESNFVAWKSGFGDNRKLPPSVLCTRCLAKQLGPVPAWSRYFLSTFGRRTGYAETATDVDAIDQNISRTFDFTDDGLVVHFGSGPIDGFQLPDALAPSFIQCQHCTRWHCRRHDTIQYQEQWENEWGVDHSVVPHDDDDDKTRNVDHQTHPCHTCRVSTRSFRYQVSSVRCAKPNCLAVHDWVSRIHQCRLHFDLPDIFILNPRQKSWCCHRWYCSVHSFGFCYECQTWRCHSCPHACESVNAVYSSIMSCDTNLVPVLVRLIEQYIPRLLLQTFTLPVVSRFYRPTKGTVVVDYCWLCLETRHLSKPVYTCAACPTLQIHDWRVCCAHSDPLALKRYGGRTHPEESQWCCGKWHCFEHTRGYCECCQLWQCLDCRHACPSLLRDLLSHIVFNSYDLTLPTSTDPLSSLILEYACVAA